MAGLPASQLRKGLWEKCINSQGSTLLIAPTAQSPGASLHLTQCPSGFENKEGLGPLKILFILIQLEIWR